jgi:cell division protein FtsL
VKFNIYNIHSQMRLLDTLEEYASTKQQKEEEKRRSRVGFTFPCFYLTILVTIIMFSLYMLPC